MDANDLSFLFIILFQLTRGELPAVDRQPRGRGFTELLGGGSRKGQESRLEICGPTEMRTEAIVIAGERNVGSAALPRAGINRLLAVMAVGTAEGCNISPAQGSLFYGA